MEWNLKSMTDECKVTMAREVYSRSNWIGMKVDWPYNDLLI